MMGTRALWNRYRKACQDVKVTRGVEKVYLMERDEAWKALTDEEKRQAKKTANEIFRRK